MLAKTTCRDAGKRRMELTTHWCKGKKAKDGPDLDGLVDQKVDLVGHIEPEIQKFKQERSVSGQQQWKDSMSRIVCPNRAQLV